MTTYVKVDADDVVVAIAVGDTQPDGFVEGSEDIEIGQVFRESDRYILTGAEWVGRFTDDEWAWLKTRRDDGTAAGKQLDRLMDAVRWTDSIRVEPGASAQTDAFYDWLLAEGIPGGQSRIDELRAPK